MKKTRSALMSMSADCVVTHWLGTHRPLGAPLRGGSLRGRHPPAPSAFVLVRSSCCCRCSTPASAPPPPPPRPFLASRRRRVDRSARPHRAAHPTCQSTPAAKRKKNAGLVSGLRVWCCRFRWLRVIRWASSVQVRFLSNGKSFRA